MNTGNAAKVAYNNIGEDQSDEVNITVNSNNSNKSYQRTQPQNQNFIESRNKKLMNDRSDQGSKSDDGHNRI